MKLQTLLIVLLFTGNLLAQGQGKITEIKIKTSSQCEMCKERIEKTLAFEKGVKKAQKGKNGSGCSEKGHLKSGIRCRRCGGR